MAEHDFYLSDAVHILRSNGTTEHADACQWAVNEIERLRQAERLMIILATHAQGGHSDVGSQVADLLGIPFPVRMEGLSKAARDRGDDPDELWPWLQKQNDKAIESASENDGGGR